MHQVHLVDGVAAGKLPGAVAGRGDLLVAVILDKACDGVGEAPHGLGHRGGELRNIHHREGGRLTGALSGAGAHKIVHDILADVYRGHGGVVGELGEPVGVIPADTRLGLLGSDHVICIIIEHQSSLGSRHKAGIKTDKVKCYACILKC